MARNFVAASSQLIDVGDPAVLQITGRLTISCWFFLTTLPASANDYELVTKDNNTGGRAYTLDVHNGGSATNLRFYINGGGGSGNLLTGGTALSAGRWYHALATFDTAGKLTLYLNGAVDASSTGASTSIPAATANVQFGARMYSGAQEYLNGDLAEIGIWAATLTAQEGAGLAAGRLPRHVRPASLAGYWPLFGLQSPEPDLSGNANNGTLTGTTQANHAPVTTFTRKARSEVEPAAGGGFQAAWGVRPSVVLGTGVF